MDKRYIISALAALAIASGADARPARSIVSLQQPDGSRIAALLKGDERMHVLTDQQGHVLTQGEDGFYRFARYNSDGSIVNTGFRADGSDTQTPAHILRESTFVPYEALYLRAAARENAGMAIRRSRRSAPRTDNEAPARTEATPMNCVVIFAGYSDIAFRYSREMISDVFCKKGYSYDGATGSVTDYFQEQLGGEMDCSFTPGPMVTLPNTQKYYGQNDRNGNDLRPEEAVADACRLAHEAGFDFSQYDLDGDGDVDNVFIIASGKDEAEGGGDDAVWAHQWYLADGAGMNLVLDGKRINSYTISSELSYNFTKDRFGLTAIGAICHEYSHSLGLMDMYDTDGDAGGSTDGLYCTSVMDSGNYNNDSHTPPHYSAVDYDTLEAGEAEDLKQGQYTLEPIRKGRHYYRIRKPDEPMEYFLVEYRDQVDWDAYIGGQGLAIYHVDHSRRSAGYSEGYRMVLTAEDRWYYNQVNARKDNMCAAFVPSRSSISSNRQLFFPYGGTDELTPDSVVPLRFFDGTPAPIALTGIRIEGGKAIFSAVDGSAFLIPEVTGVECDSYQHCCILTTSLSKKNFLGKCSVSWGEKGSLLKTEDAMRMEEDGSFVLRLDGLSPGTEYEYSIVLSSYGATSDAITGTFRTSGSTGDQPYIYFGKLERNDDKSVKRGCKLPLEMYDIPANDGIIWFFDGQRVKCGSDGYFHIERSGILSVSIRYADGSTETITKKIAAK